MGETKIVLISKRWPAALLQKFQQSLGLVPRKAGHKLLRMHALKDGRKNNRS